MEKLENVFNTIYEKKLWVLKDGDPMSGPGSSLYSTQNLLVELPIALKKFSVKTLLDAGCGDLNWMKHLFPLDNINYIGADVVERWINEHKMNYSSYEFIKLDITKDKLPCADLMLCRDCLFHLSFGKIYNVLNNFLKSDIQYLAATSNFQIKNKNIKTGYFRLLDLRIDPFNFPEPLHTIIDYSEGDAQKILGFWSKDQINDVIRNKNRIK